MTMSLESQAYHGGLNFQFIGRFNVLPLGHEVFGHNLDTWRDNYYRRGLAVPPLSGGRNNSNQPDL
jgi:hypothetical protein